MSISRRIIRLLGALLPALLVAWLAACASPTAFQQTEFPGTPYAWGSDQRQETFRDIQIAQTRLIEYKGPTSWANVTPGPVAKDRVVGLTAYHPMQARWKLKDGRQYVLNRVDQAEIVRKAHLSHVLKPQWVREGRRQTIGDLIPTLAHELEGDALRIKWIIYINHTPVAARLRADGAANRWDIEQEEHIIGVVKGLPAGEIDFATQVP